MAGALYPRIKNWGSTDTLIASDLNAEFDNILTNFKPQMMDAYSANVAQMQVQTSPGAVGTESLATSLSGELERIRFQLASITGNTYWYSAPAASLITLNTALGANTQANSVTSGRALSTSSQPVYLVPSGSTNTLTVKATATPLVYKIAGVAYTLSADLPITSLTVAPSTNNTLTINDTSLSGQAFTKLLGENGSTITVSGMGSEISSQVGKIVALKTSTTEYVLARVQSTTQLSTVYRGYFFQSNDTLFSRAAVTSADSWTLMKLTWIYLNTAGAASVVYTNPRVGGTQPTSPATGDMWFDTSANIWKTYNSTTFVASNSTLIGICIQNTTATIGARSADFFKVFTDENTVEIMTQATTQIRSRYTGPRINIYGTPLQFQSDFVNWDTGTDMDSGQTFSASTFYYMYIKESGASVISDIAPFDRRGDLKGFYHPLNTWRCVGYSFANGSVNFSTTNPETESFHKSGNDRNVSTLTAAVASYPFPTVMPTRTRQEFIYVNGASGAFTQVLEPAAQWKGERRIFCRTDSSIGNVITLQAYGTTVLTTTGNATAASTSYTNLAATTGLASGITYNVQGPGITPRTTATWGGSGTTITLSQAASSSVTGGAITFSTGNTIRGDYRYLLHMLEETAELYSTGTEVVLLNRHVPLFLTRAGLTGSFSPGGAGVIIYDTVIQGTGFSTGTGLLTVPFDANVRVGVTAVGNSAEVVNLRINAVNTERLCAVASTAGGGAATAPVLSGDSVAIWVGANLTFTAIAAGVFLNRVSFELAKR